MKSPLLILLSFLFLQLPITYAQNFPDATWEKVKSPTFYGWDQAKLDALEEYTTDKTATTGMLIIQDGRIIYEYGNVTENSYIASCRKSVLAMLYGKYVANKTINLEQSLADLDITYEGLLLEIERQATVKDILSSRSGVYLPAANGGDMIHLAPERGTVKPGELWVYNNWDFNMAGYIFEKQTQRNIYDEIGAQFAVPMQMEDWDRSIQEKEGNPLITDVLAYHINFSARDMARLGWLMLNKGKWKKQQIIPEFWVEEMTQPSTTFAEVDKIAPFVKNEFNKVAYGYMWWLLHEPKHKALEKAYSAQGAWGQNITIIPAMNAVVVIKTNNLYLRQKGDHSYMLDQIARAYSPTLGQELQPLAAYLTKDYIGPFTLAYKKMLPKSATINFQIAINKLAYHYLHEVKDYDKALTLFQLNVSQHPSSWLVYDGLAEAYFMMEDYDNALKNYEKALQLNTENEWDNNPTVSYIIERLKKRK
ncbi:MAG: serine hydrolase [Aureispira sp.]